MTLFEVTFTTQYIFLLVMQNCQSAYESYEITWNTF